MRIGIIRDGSKGLPVWWSTAVAAGLIYFVLATLTIKLTSIGGGIATVWPANAVLLALMMRHGRNRWIPILGAGYVANIAANLITRDTLLGPLMFGSANILEAAVAAFLMRRFDKQGEFLETPASLIRFIAFAGLAAPLASSLFGAFTAWTMMGDPFLESLITWIVCDGLGLLIFTPFFYALFSGNYARPFRNSDQSQRLEAIFLQLLVLVVAAAIFANRDLPLLFLVAIPLTIVTLRLGWLGTIIAVQIVAIVGTVFTVLDLGPISLAQMSAKHAVLFLQFFLASILLVQFPVAAMLRAKQSAFDELRDSEQSVQFLARQSCILLLHFDQSGRCVKAVGNARPLLGIGEDLLIGSGVDAISPGHDAMIHGAYLEALENPYDSSTAEFRSRLNADRWLEARFRASYNEYGTFKGSFATIQDITERKAQELTLAAHAETDHLTGVLNRKGFMERLESIPESAGANGPHLAMIDVDRFKLVNDSSGHLAGDLALKVLAETLMAETRTDDLIGRLGGDEFAILLMTGNRDEAEKICERIVAAVSARTVTLPSRQTLNLQISCGLAQYRGQASKDAWLHDADIALYEAKRAGRNRLVAA